MTGSRVVDEAIGPSSPFLEAPLSQSPSEGRLDPRTDTYFRPGISWQRRHASACEGLSPFEAANSRLIARSAESGELRVVVNMPAEALLAMLGGDHYRNCYELPFVAGERRGPSAKRIRVDALLGFVPDGRDVYFAALSLGGAGVRFYGEYCVALDVEAVGEPALLDRNSYELLEPPLLGHPDPSALVEALRASWGERATVLSLKVLQGAQQTRRLLPLGAIAEQVLRDEDFVEVHLRVKLTARAIEEVRQAPEELTRDDRIRQRLGRGLPPTPSELLWTQRRAQVDRAMVDAGVRSRVVTTNGRGTRWR